MSADEETHHGGYPCAELPTIYPQPHDVPMDWIVTGSLTSLRRIEPPGG